MATVGGETTSLQTCRPLFCSQVSKHGLHLVKPLQIVLHAKNAAAQGQMLKTEMGRHFGTVREVIRLH